MKISDGSKNLLWPTVIGQFSVAYKNWKIIPFTKKIMWMNMLENKIVDDEGSHNGLNRHDVHNKIR